MKINLFVEKIERHHHIIMLIILLMMLLAPLAYTQAQPCNAELSETHVDVTCYGVMNGSITLTTAISSGSLDYLWSDGNTDQNRSNLGPGTYTVTATDGEYCSDSLTVIIAEPAELIASESHVAAICASSLNSVAVSATGGVTPYTFLWNDGNTNENRDHLNAGSYTVTVTDVSGCTKQLTVTFNNASFAASMGKPTLIQCSNSCDGSLKANVPSGAPYYFQWNTGATTNIISNLCAGYYTVTVTNSSGCSRKLSTHICGPKKTTAVATITQITANNANNGTVTWSTSGGTAPYSYLWNDGYTTGNRTNIAAGKYTITVTDAHACTTSKKLTWKNPPLRMGVNEITDNLTISPNPSCDKFEVELNVETNSSYSAEVIDIEGRIVLFKKYELTEGAQRLTFDMSEKPKGIYTLCVWNAERRFIKKLVLY